MTGTNCQHMWVDRAAPRRAFSTHRVPNRLFDVAEHKINLAIITVMVTMITTMITTMRMAMATTMTTTTTMTKTTATTLNASRLSKES